MISCFSSKCKILYSVSVRDQWPEWFLLRGSERFWETQISTFFLATSFNVFICIRSASMYGNGQIMQTWQRGSRLRRFEHCWRMKTNYILSVMTGTPNGSLVLLCLLREGWMREQAERGMITGLLKRPRRRQKRKWWEKMGRRYAYEIRPRPTLSQAVHLGWFVRDTSLETASHRNDIY